VARNATIRTNAFSRTFPRTPCAGSIGATQCRESNVPISASSRSTKLSEKSAELAKASEELLEGSRKLRERITAIKAAFREGKVSEKRTLIGHLPRSCIKKRALETAFDSTGPSAANEGRASRLHNGTRTPAVE
jgi:hypothetical protein